MVEPTKENSPAYIKITQYMCEGCQTQVATRTGNTEYVDVKMDLHQGSAI